MKIQIFLVAQQLYMSSCFFGFCFFNPVHIQTDNNRATVRQEFSARSDRSFGCLYRLENVLDRHRERVLFRLDARLRNRGIEFLNERRSEERRMGVWSDYRVGMASQNSRRRLLPGEIERMQNEARMEGRARRARRRLSERPPPPTEGYFNFRSVAEADDSIQNLPSDSSGTDEDTLLGQTSPPADTVGGRAVEGGAGLDETPPNGSPAQQPGSELSPISRDSLLARGRIGVFLGRHPVISRVSDSNNGDAAAMVGLNADGTDCEVVWNAWEAAEVVDDGPRERLWVWGLWVWGRQVLRYPIALYARGDPPRRWGHENSARFFAIERIQPNDGSMYDPPPPNHPDSLRMQDDPRTRALQMLFRAERHRQMARERDEQQEQARLAADRRNVLDRGASYIDPTPSAPVGTRNQCAICLGDLDACERNIDIPEGQRCAHCAQSEVTQLLPCKHLFHAHCAKGWLETFKFPRSGQCPLCREITFRITHHQNYPHYSFGDVRNLFNITAQTDEHRNSGGARLPDFFRTEEITVSESPPHAIRQEMDEVEDEQRRAAEQLMLEREEDQRYEDQLVNELLDDAPAAAVLAAEWLGVDQQVLQHNVWDASRDDPAESHTSSVGLAGQAGEQDLSVDTETSSSGQEDINGPEATQAMLWYEDKEEESMEDADVAQVVAEYCAANGINNIPDVIRREDCSHLCLRFVCWTSCTNYAARERELQMVAQQGMLYLIRLSEEKISHQRLIIERVGQIEREADANDERDQELPQGPPELDLPEPVPLFPRQSLLVGGERRGGPAGFFADVAGPSGIQQGGGTAGAAGAGGGASGEDQEDPDVTLQEEGAEGDGN